MTKRSDATELNARALAHIANDTLDIGADVGYEPRDAYVGQDRFDAEVEMLKGLPHVIGWAGEVGLPGQFTTKDVMGVPVLVSRDRAGALNAFINGCAHRGAQVATGSGDARLWECPYHGWSYGLDGRLVGVPARAMFAGANLVERGLRRLPITDSCGLLTIGLTSDVTVDGHLDDVAEPLSNYSFGTYHHFETRRFDVAANWKLNMAINFEGYHFKYIHEKTLWPFATNNSPLDIYGKHSRWAFPFRQLSEYRGKPVEQWPDHFVGEVAYGLFPTCVIVEGPGITTMLRIYPGRTPGESVVYLTQGSTDRIETDQQRTILATLLDSTALIYTTEDIPAAESCQRGLEAGVDHVVFGRNEPLLSHLADVWRDAMREREGCPVR